MIQTGSVGHVEFFGMRRDLDHTGSTPSPVLGLDPDKLWEVGESVSRAIKP
jgi:hypothetical protein